MNEQKYISIWLRILLTIFFSFIPLFFYTPLNAQDGPYMSGLEGKSYLDGCDLPTIMGLENAALEFELVTYLDDIEFELEALEKLSRGEGPVDGFYAELDDCVHDALERHMPLEIAKDKISLARRKLFKAVRDLFPSIKLEYSHDLGWKLYKSDPDPTDADDEGQQFRSERVRASISQPLFRGGALWNQVRVERAGLHVAKEEYKKVYADVMVEIARAYYSVVRAKTILSYKEELYAAVSQMLVISQEKMDAGLISEIEHLNVQSQQSQIEHDLEAAREDLELNIVEFRKVLHLTIDEKVDVPLFDEIYVTALEKKIGEESALSEKTADKEKEKKLDELMKLAYQNRPEFVIQKKKLEAVTWLEKVANAKWFPQINLVYERGQKAEAYRAIDNSPYWDDEQRIGIECSWNFGGSTVQYGYDKNRQGTGVEATDPTSSIGDDGYYDRKNAVSYSLLDGLDQFAATKEAAIKRQEALLELELSEKDIVSEVKEVYYNYNRVIIQLKSIFKKLAYRDKLVSLAQHRSEINEIQISEYIQAQLDLVQERTKLYQSIVDYMVAKVSLNKATGVQDFISLESE